MGSDKIRALDKWCVDRECCNPGGYHYCIGVFTSDDWRNPDDVTVEMNTRCRCEGGRYGKRGYDDEETGGLRCFDCGRRWIPAPIEVSVSAEKARDYGLTTEG